MKGRGFMVVLAMLVVMSQIGAIKVVAIDTFCNGSQSSDNPTINTALGCVPVRVDQFMTWLLPYLFGIAGGISFLLMVYGFILMSTSGGDPKAVAGAQETITSAITGLLVSIFAIFILRLITVGILKIPGIN
jgi:hypothetical protein